MLHDSTDRFLEVFLAAFRTVFSHRFREAVTESDLIRVAHRVGSIVGGPPLVKEMEQNDNKGKVTMVMITQAVYVASHFLGELSQLLPRGKQSQVSRGSVVGVSVDDGKSPREKDLEVGVEACGVNCHEGCTVLPAIAVNETELRRVNG